MADDSDARQADGRGRAPSEAPSGAPGDAPADTQVPEGTAAGGRTAGRTPRRRRAARHAGRALHLALRLVFGLAMLAVLLAGLLFLRLTQGPIHLPFAAEAAARVFNAGSDRVRAEAGDMILTLGEEGAPAGVQFVDVRLSYATGELLFVVPRLAARFHVSDLVQGRLRPISVTVIRPEARLERSAEGRFRFGLGPWTGVGERPPEAEAVPAAPVQFAAVGRILDGLTGDAEPAPALSRLEEIVIRDARFTFANPAAGRSWQTRHADFRVWRAADGLRARMEVGLAAGTEAGAEAGAGAVVTAFRPPGTEGATRLEARFENLRPEHLAEQLAQMEWLKLFEARLDGRLEATLHPDGRVEGLAGRISAEDGRILALGDGGEPFDNVRLEFAYEAGRERMRVHEFSLEAPAAEARLAGFAELRREADGTLGGLAGQFQVARLRADVPQVFAEPLAFEAGQIVARLDLEPLTIEVAPSHLRSGDLVFEVEGRARAGEDGWQSSLRAGGRNITIAQLVRFWPHVAVGSARAWVERNMRAGMVDALVAHMRFGGARPDVSLDFIYSGLESSYLDEMSPIVAARGRGSLTLDAFHMTLESGEVHPVEGEPVRLDGSELRIPDLEAQPVVAEITLRGQGPTAHVLTLIDQEPLRLTSKLGLAPESVGGAAEVTAWLGFPLIDELDLNGVEVTAEATLRQLAMPFELPGGPVVEVRADAVALRADPREMRVAGPVRVDGRPLELEWNEYYGRGDDHRTIALAGPVTPEFLDRLELGTEYFAGGEAPMRLNLAQIGDPDFSFDLEADLGPARLVVSEFDWQKPPGPPGSLVAEGSFGQGIRAPSFRLDTDELKAEGAITFAEGGGMQTAEVDRLRFRGLADVALRAESLGDAAGTLRLEVGGRRLDLELFESDDDGTGGEGEAEPGRPLDVTYDIAELVITPKFVARPAQGSYRRDAAGLATASLEGALAGQVPFTADYEKTPGEPASVSVRSDDAGGLLSAAGLFAGAVGGQLRLEARLAPEPGTDLAGVARIEDVRIHSGGTFRSMLDEGGVDEAARAAETGGLSFDRVRVPFEYRDGVMELGESLARGNMLAVKLEGTVDENTDAVELNGVISPAYGLTGALDSIPLLGTILSGGKGEGIVAMTFQLDGTLDEPSFTVNPLSLLTPGILRNIFSGRADTPDERFLEQLRRNRD